MGRLVKMLFLSKQVQRFKTVLMKSLLAACFPRSMWNHTELN